MKSALSVRPQVQRLFLVGLASMIALAGCGSDAKSVTKAEFIKNADAICKKYAAQGDKLSEEVFGDLDENTPPEEIAEAFLESLLPVFEEQVKELKALDRPKADKEKLGKMLDNLEAASDDLAKRLKDDPESALSGEDPFAASDKEAQDYGLKECGSSG